MLPDEQPGSEQIAILRRMTGQQRLKLAEEMFWAARRLISVGVRHQHPDWSEEAVEAEVQRHFLAEAMKEG